MAKQTKINLPAHEKFMRSVVQALKQLGGSGSIEEINERVAEIEKLSEEQLTIPHGNGRTKFEYRLAWARTYLKKAGFLENSAKGIWALTKADIDPKIINGDEIAKKVRSQFRDITKKGSKAITNKKDKSDVIQQVDFDTEIQWKDILLERLYKLTPDAFERLAQRILRESGFIQVEVTGRSGDGGIDGKGIVRISGFLSFHVLFQCKRYKGSVTPSQIRDFRGAMEGRAAKGLIITTGSFTRDAIKEATRDGANPLDLIDGEILCEKLRELNLGVEKKMIEEIVVKSEWFDNL